MKRKHCTKCIFPVLISLLCLTAGFASCSEEDDGYVYPSLLSDFADISTDASGVVSYLETDKGMRLQIVNASEATPHGTVPDTVYRTVSRYELMKGGVKLYSWQAVPSLLPESFSAFSDSIKTDPLEMQSVWRSGRYLNLILLVKTLGGKHHFRVVKDSLIHSATGTGILYLRLSHDAGDDVEAYTAKAFLSVSLAGFPLGGSDSVKISIPTVWGWQQWGR